MTGLGYALKVYGFKQGIELNVGSYDLPQEAELIGECEIPTESKIDANISEYDRVMLILHQYFSGTHQRFCINNICAT